MTALADPIADLDLSVLEEMDLNLNPKCDNDECDNDATHTITCPCDKGMEFSCKTCIDSMLQAAQQNPLYGAIHFDPSKSCGHATLIFLCTISPL